MKVLTIPVIHGSHEWEAAKKLPVTAYDYAVFLGDFVVLSEKDININRKNNLIVADSNSHHIFDVIDTENLPGNEMSLLARNLPIVITGCFLSDYFCAIIYADETE